MLLCLGHYCSYCKIFVLWVLSVISFWIWLWLTHNGYIVCWLTITWGKFLVTLIQNWVLHRIYCLYHSWSFWLNMTSLFISMCHGSLIFKICQILVVGGYMHCVCSRQIVHMEYKLFSKHLKDYNFQSRWYIPYLLHHYLILMPLFSLFLE
jgi:hypothetical protein